MKTLTVRFVMNDEEDAAPTELVINALLKSLRLDNWLVGVSLSGDTIVAREQPILELAVQQEKS